MGDRQNDGVSGLELVKLGRLDMEFMLDLGGFSHRVMGLDGNAEALESVNDIEHFRIADIGHVFLEGEAENGDGRVGAAIGKEHADAFLRDAGTYSIIGAATGENDLRMATGFFSPVGEIIGVDAYAMSADEAGAEGQEVPFGASGLQNVDRVDVEGLKHFRQFVHERDVEIALGVLDNFGRFRDLDGRRAVHTGFHNRFIDGSDDIKGCGVLAGDDFGDGFKAVDLIARIDAFGRIAEREINAALQTGMALKNRHAILFRGAGIDG